MNKTHWMTVLGLIVSFSLIGVVLPRLDWPTFSLTLRSVSLPDTFFLDGQRGKETDWYS
jgi:hypothetical protein